MISTVISRLISIAAGLVQLYFMNVSKIFIETLQDLGETRLKTSGQK